MNLAIQYFNQQSPGVIIAGQKDGSNDLGVYYTGTRQELEVLRGLINESIDQLQSREEVDLTILE